MAKDIRQRINAQTAKKSFCDQIAKREEEARAIYEQIDRFVRETGEIVLISVRSEMGRKHEEIKIIQRNILRTKYDASKSGWLAEQIQGADKILEHMRIVLNAARQRKEAIDRATAEEKARNPEARRSDYRWVSDGIQFARDAQKALCEIGTHPEVAYRIVGVSPALAMEIAKMINQMDADVDGRNICIAVDEALVDYRVEHLFGVKIPESPKMRREEVLRLIADVAGSFARDESPAEEYDKAAMART